MKRHTFIAFLLFMLCITSVLAFPGAVRESGTTFTIAGPNRSCSDGQDEKGTFIGTKYVTSNSYPALINLYSCKNNDPACDQGWTYIGEYEAPHTFSYPGKYMAWDVYYCQDRPSTCTDGQKRIVTEKSYQTCKNGAWGPEQQCGALQYFDLETSSCGITICKEAWTCNDWGACTDQGTQYRTCTDTRSCGTYKDAPKTQRTCTPTPSDGPSTVSAWKASPPLVMIGQPTIDDNTFAVKAGDTITVRQKYQVNKAGSYWIEAGLDQTKTFSVVDVTQNTCDPEETWYKNEKESFTTTGVVEKTFSLVVPNDGEYVLHTAIVTGCKGEVLDQQNQVDRVIAGASKDNDGNKNDWTAKIVVGLVIFVVSAAVMGGLIGLGVWAFKKKKR